MINGRRLDASVDGPTLIAASLNFAATFGYGAMDTWRTYQGKDTMRAEHLTRLETTASAMGLSHGFDAKRLATRIEGAQSDSGFGECVIKVIFSHAPSEGMPVLSHLLNDADENTPWELILLRPIAFFERTLQPEVISLVTEKVGDGAGTLKTVSYAKHLLSLRHARTVWADDVLWVDALGHVLETATCNAFAIFGKAIVTPPLALPILPGTVRRQVLTVGAHLGHTIKEISTPITDWYRADEIFVTSAIRGLRSVGMLDDKALGQPLIATQLHQALQDLWL